MRAGIECDRATYHVCVKGRRRPKKKVSARGLKPPVRRARKKTDGGMPGRLSGTGRGQNIVHLYDEIGLWLGGIEGPTPGSEKTAAKGAGRTTEKQMKQFLGKNILQTMKRVETEKKNVDHTKGETDSK